MSSPVANAVEPLRAAAIERARKEAAQVAEAVLELYSKKPEAFVVPILTWTNKSEVERARGNLALLRAIASKGESSLIRDEAKIATFIEQAGKDAEAAYTAFVLKLELKIGAHESAVLTGDHVWHHSDLRVGKGSTFETWRTKMIVNVSKHGKLFNQWPTRKVKR